MSYKGETMAKAEDPSQNDAPQIDTPADVGSSRAPSLHVDGPPDLSSGSDSEMDFAGWGTVEQLDVTRGPKRAPAAASHGPAHKLKEFASTAICGNDITSSCLYVAALATLYGGKYGFLCLAAVAAMLYLFRKIYAEVVTALPLNGGAYNALLNTTSKYFASIAACLTILSYMATACISAYEAMHYAHTLWHGLPIIVATLVLLGIFMLLSIIGITESAMAAMGIFCFHLLTLSLLVVCSVVEFGFDLTTFKENWAQEPPGGVGQALFFGFAAGLLGISGFESSANFVEEQEKGVFTKTLRNMWLAVAFFNHVISLLAMCVMPMDQAIENKNSFLA